MLTIEEDSRHPKLCPLLIRFLSEQAFLCMLERQSSRRRNAKPRELRERLLRLCSVVSTGPLPQMPDDVQQSS